MHIIFTFVLISQVRAWKNTEINVPEIQGRIYPSGGRILSYRIVCFKDLHPFFEEIVLMILDEGSTDAQALLL